MRDPEEHVTSVAVSQQLDGRYAVDASREMPLASQLEHQVYFRGPRIERCAHERRVLLRDLRADLRVYDFQSRQAPVIAAREFLELLGPLVEREASALFGQFLDDVRLVVGRRDEHRAIRIA